MPETTAKHSFFTTLKRGVAMILLMSLMVPALSLSVSPPQPAHASALTGLVVSSAMCIAQQLLGAFTSLASIIGDVLGGVLSPYVPVRETNETVLSSLRSIQTTSAESARATFLNLVKECILDPIVWYLKELLITQLTEEILGSIKDGFLGGPMFETNPIRFFRNVADASFNTFLFDTDVIAGQVLPSLQDRIRESLFRDYYTPSFTADGTGAETATLSNAEYELLFAGNIMETEGGILALLELSEDRNNPAGSYFSLTSETGARMSKVLAQESSLLSYGDGWHSNRCDEGDADAPIWYVCTPGTWIAQQMDDWSNGSLKQLQAADEFSEIMQALLAALVSEIIGNDETGLLQSLPEGYWASTTREFGSSDGGMDEARDIWDDIEETQRQEAIAKRSLLMQQCSALVAEVEASMLTGTTEQCEVVDGEVETVTVNNPDLDALYGELVSLCSNIENLSVTYGPIDSVIPLLAEYDQRLQSLELAFNEIQLSIEDTGVTPNPDTAIALRDELIVRLDAVAEEINVWMRYLEGDIADEFIADIRELQDELNEVDVCDPLALGIMQDYAQMVDLEEEFYEEWRVDAATAWKQRLLTAIDAHISALVVQRNGAIWLRDGYVSLYNSTLASCENSSSLLESSQSLSDSSLTQYDSAVAQYNATLATYQTLQAEYDAALASLADLQLQYATETDPILLAELEAQIIALEADIAAKEMELASLEAELITLQSQIDTLDSQLDTIDGQINNTADQLANCEAQLASYQAQINTLNAQINTLTSQINQLQNLRNDVQAVNPSSSDSLPRLLDLESQADELGVPI